MNSRDGSASIARSLLTGGSFALLNLACSGNGDHAPFVVDCIDDEDCANALIYDAGPIGGGSTEPDTSGPRECLENLNDSSPSTGRVKTFADAFFDPTDLVNVEGPADVSTLAENAYGYACASWDGESDFELVGSELKTGALRVDPVGDSPIFPTVIDRVNLRSASLPTIPVFTNDQVDAIFEQLDTTRDPDKAQILIEVACPGAVVPGRNRQSGAQFLSSAAEAIAYSSGAGFSEDLDSTNSDGLALLINVDSDEGVGNRIAIEPLNSTVDVINAASSDGAMTLVIFCPGG